MKVIAVIRSNGERTRELCSDLVRQQIEAEVLSIAPFTDAVKRCFEIGIEQKADWLLTIDADVLVFPTAVDSLIELARRVPRQVFHFQGMIQDRLSKKPRPAGHRMYRGSHLERLLPLVEEHIRVEANLIQKYRKTGFSHYGATEVIGKHDYEQWYRDLYRKAAVHSVKHSVWNIAHWERGDKDLRAAWAGWHGLPWDEPEKEPLC